MPQTYIYNLNVCELNWLYVTLNQHGAFALYGHSMQLCHALLVCMHGAVDEQIGRNSDTPLLQ
jgi:hypothetical protein